MIVMTEASYDSRNYVAEDPNVTVTPSNFAPVYVSPNKVTFGVTVAAGAPTEADAFMLTCQGAGIFGGPGTIEITPCALPPPTPVITSITPAVWKPGKSIPITITGSGFVPVNNPNGCNSTEISVTGGSGSQDNIAVSGITVVSATEITATVKPQASDPAETATVGAYNYLLNTPPNYLSGSATALVTACAVPNIASISPNIWFAGQTSDNVTITGTGFITSNAATKTCPATTVTVTMPDQTVVVPGAVTVNNSTTITIASVTPPASETTGGATITLSGGLTPSPNADVLGAPVITWTSDPNGSNPTISGPNATLPNPSAVVGQQILLNPTPTAATLSALPVPLTFSAIAPTTWTVTGGTNIGGYTVVSPTAATPSVSSATVNPLTLNTNNLAFFSVESPTFVEVTYTYCITGQTTCPESAATFEMTGPIGATMTVTLGPLLPAVFNSASPPIFGVGNGVTLPGIIFTASDQDSSPGGQFSFVQTINYQLTTRSDSVEGTCNETTGTGLDTVYPYGNASTSSNSATTNDSPSTQLGITDEEVITTEYFTMYAMWTPTVTQSSPTPVPVPIGSINWQWYADAAQTSSDPPYAWTMNPKSDVTNPTSSAGAFSPSLTYPIWGSAGYSGTHPCVPEGSQE